MTVELETTITVTVTREVEVDTLDELQVELEQFKGDAYLDGVILEQGDRGLWLNIDLWRGVEDVKISDYILNSDEETYFEEVEEDKNHPLNPAFYDSDTDE